VTPTPVAPGVVIKARPVGVLLMRDEKGEDEKVLAVPIDKLNPFYTSVRTFEDLPPLLIEQITHFFRHYKDLEPGKTASIGKWAGLDVCHERITSSINNALKAWQMG
jgi:inorganic pyrophosphatase